MKMEQGEGMLRSVPIALVLTVLLQGGAAVWWVSAKARDGFFLEQRVSTIESSMNDHRKTEEAMHDRLARIEERVGAQLILLDRIEKQIQSLHR